MAFPVTPRYRLIFRKSDTGLTPTFVFFKRADTFANVTPPSIVEQSDGCYYFDFTFTTFSDPDIVFQVDGGPSIPTEEVRYINGGMSPRDRFIDIPISGMAASVWEELITGHQTASSTGRLLNDVFRLLRNKAIINPTSKQLEIYNDAGSGIVFAFDLKDDVGVASATKIFQRIPA